MSVFNETSTCVAPPREISSNRWWTARPPLVPFSGGV